MVLTKVHIQVDIMIKYKMKYFCVFLFSQLFQNKQTSYIQHKILANVSMPKTICQSIKQKKAEKTFVCCLMQHSCVITQGIGYFNCIWKFQFNSLVDQ